MRKKLLLFLFLFFTGGILLAQKTITGKVTDDKGEAIPNASVTVKGTSNGTVTDATGSFSFTIAANAKTLVISAVDFTSQEISIGNNNSYTVKLKLQDKSLQEVVVVGYGTQRKLDNVGSVSSIKGVEIAQRPIQSFEAGLAGKATGVQITSPNGLLNNPPVFRIRGTNSISLSSYPLIVIDGVPTYTGDASGTNAPGNALASINPNDIESIDIAKDAAATAIYGSRAANGVVFVTTKKGKAGKARISYDGWLGFSKAFRLPELLDAFQYVDVKNQAVANNPSQLATLGANPFKLTNDANGNPINTNWYDEVYRSALSHNHALSVSGGNDATKYYFGVGYTNQEGIVKSNNFIRQNILFNVDSRVSKLISVGGKIAFSNEKNNIATSSGSLSGEAFGIAGLGRTALVNAPNVASYKADGSYNIVLRPTPPASPDFIGVMNNAVPQVGFFNPAILLDKNRSNSESNHIQANAFIQLNLLQGLAFRSVYGIDYLNVDNDLFWNPLHGDGQTYGGFASASYSKNKTWLWTNTLQYDKQIGNHSLGFLAGHEQQRRTGRGFGINRQTLSDPVFTEIQAGWVTNNTAGMGFGENYLTSVFGRLTYDYAKRYFITGTLRQDEYSGLGKKKGVFGGGSIGWEVTEEGFWKRISALNNLFSGLRIKASYGTVGNIAGIGDYSPYSTYGSGLYGGSPTLSFSGVGNPLLEWETSKKLDIGLSFSLLDKRIGAEITYFKNDVDNLILNVPQAASTGLGSVAANIGSMYNKGWEFELNATPVMKKDFSWNTSFNLTLNKNMVTSLAPGLEEITYSTSGSELTNKTKVGYPVGYLFMVRNGGVDPATGRRIVLNSENKQVFYQHYAPAGQFNWSFANGTKYVGPNGETSVSQAADGVMYGNSQPKQFGGWTNTLRYKNFDFSALVTYQAGYYIYYGSGAGLLDQRFWNNTTDVLDSWKKAGDVTDIPKIIYGDNVSNGSALTMSANVHKGDFIKLRNLSLGYSLPESLLSKVKINTARLYISGQNLAIWTKYIGPDPEVSSNGNSVQGQGVDRNTIGNARTLTVGLNVGF